MENPSIKIIKKTTNEKQGFEPLGRIISRLLKGNKIFYEELALATLQKFWLQVAGELAQYAEVTGYKNMTIYLEAASSSWAQQLSFYKQLLIEKYKNFTPIKIKDLKVGSAGVIKKTEKPEHTELSSEEIKDLENFCAELDPDTGEKMKSILKKSKLFSKQDKRRHCVICGLKLDGEKLVCFSCQEKKVKTSNSIIHEYLLEAPWSRYQDISRDLPDIDEDRYHQVKEQLIRQIADQLQRARYRQEKASVKEKALIQRQVMLYTMLRTGLTPQKISDNIVKECMGDKLYRILCSQPQ